MMATSHRGYLARACGSGSLSRGRLSTYEMSSWASSPREVTPALVKMFRRWKATVRVRHPALGGDVLVGHALADQLGDLALHRGELELRGRVAFAGGLPGRAQLLGRAGGQRLRAQVLERLQRGPQVGARVDAALGTAQELAVREVGPGPVVRTAPAVSWLARGEPGRCRTGRARRRVRRAGRGRGRRRPAPTATRCLRRTGSAA